MVWILLCDGTFVHGVAPSHLQGPRNGPNDHELAEKEPWMSIRNRPHDSSWYRHISAHKRWLGAEASARQRSFRQQVSARLQLNTIHSFTPDPLERDVLLLLMHFPFFSSTQRSSYLSSMLCNQSYTMRIFVSLSSLLPVTSIYGKALGGVLIRCPSRATGDCVCNVGGNTQTWILP